jgi:hypothetical protein
MREGSRQEELEREGWVRQFAADEPRLSEAVELYDSLGLEVHLEPVTPDESVEGCQICFEVDGDRYKTIYTRPKQGDVVSQRSDHPVG